jgi:hypothetical protein
MGCSGGRNGGWSRSAEFEQFQWKLEQFQRWLVRWRWRWGMVGAKRCRAAFTLMDWSLYWDLE